MAYTIAMAEPHRYKGVARDGKIELEPGANLPDGAEVIVMFGEVRDDEDDPVFMPLSRLDSLIGIWADRTDIEDSVKFARELRERAWKRTG